MKKKNNTIAALAMSLAAIAAPTQANSISQQTLRSANQTSEAAKSETQAVVNTKEKGQGVIPNPDTGGVDFDFPRMFAIPNPIFYPKKHTIQSYRSQQRAKLAKRKSKA